MHAIKCAELCGVLMELFKTRVLNEMLKLIAISLFVTGLTIPFVVGWELIDSNPIIIVVVSFCGFMSVQQQPLIEVTSKQVILHIIAGLATLATFLAIQLSGWIAVVSIIFFPAMFFPGSHTEAPIFKVIRTTLIIAGVGLGYAL
jgi:hypothetical protein